MGQLLASNMERGNEPVTIVGGNIVNGYMVMDTGTNMLTVVKAARLKGIISLAHILYLVVKDVLGLGSTVGGHLGCCQL